MLKHLTCNPRDNPHPERRRVRHPARTDGEGVTQRALRTAEIAEKKFREEERGTGLKAGHYKGEED
jgi:hypothetical protein